MEPDVNGSVVRRDVDVVQQVGAIVVGTGFGVLTHARALRAAGIDVRALVGRDLDKAKLRADVLGIPAALTSLEDALALPDVDVVTIATPPHTHAEIALAAIAAGKHVICEKPFARDAAEAREMSAAAERAGVTHLLGTEFRFATAQASLQRTIAGGAIGQPRSALFMLEIPTLVDPAAELPAWWEDAAQGGGWLGAYGSHVVDQVRSTLGEFAGVSASLHTLAPRASMTADDTYTVHFKLTDGCTGVMHSSCAIGGQFVATTKITGTSGSAWTQGDEVWIDRGDGPQRIPDPTDLPIVAPDPPPAQLLHTTYDMWHSMGLDLAPYTRLCARLRAGALGEAVVDDPPAATFADGVAGQIVLDAIRRSSSEGGWIAVERA
jgi:predicted dehydrogenase